MKALLLCGYRASDHQEEPLGLRRDENGLTLIDHRIQQLHQIGLEIVCVVSGATADEQLRHCTQIAKVELVYDDDSEACLASNVRAGLTAVAEEGCFVIPLEVPCPPPEMWRFLKEEWRKVRFDSPYAVLQARKVEGTPFHFGFPLVITRRGHQLIRDNPDIRSLVNTRLEFLHLAPDENPI
jgi:CTP:molybdopterin cytidylyltransferase MocA